MKKDYSNNAQVHQCLAPISQGVEKQGKYLKIYKKSTMQGMTSILCQNVGNELPNHFDLRVSI